MIDRGPYVIYYSIPCSLLLKPVWFICYSIKHSSFRFLHHPSLCMKMLFSLDSLWLDSVLRSLLSSHLSLKSLFSYHPILNSHLSTSSSLDQFSSLPHFSSWNSLLFGFSPSTRFFQSSYEDKDEFGSVLFTPMSPLTQIMPDT